MPNGFNNQWLKNTLRHLLSRKSNRFDLKLGELINLTLRFYVDEYLFSTLSDSCHGNKENSIFAVTITTNQEIQICALILSVHFVIMPKNFRAKSTSCSLDKMLQLLNFQFCEKQL